MGMLDGKTALVTGAGRGIGRGIALALAHAGAKVVVNDLGASLAGDGIERGPADVVVSEITKEGGVAQANYGSVADFAEGTAMVGQVVKAWGKIDILVNVAGILRDRMLFNMTEEEWDAVIAVHLKGTFNTTRAASVHMRQQKSGRVISMSSVSALGAPGQPNYAAGKAGIVGVTKTLAKEWGQFNIQVNAVAFGFIETRLTQAKESGEHVTRESADIALGIPQQMRELAFKLIPMGRGGTTEEGAGPVLFFCSRLSDYVSGQVLEVTGGL